MSGIGFLTVSVGQWRTSQSVDESSLLNHSFYKFNLYLLYLLSPNFCIYLHRHTIVEGTCKKADGLVVVLLRYALIEWVLVHGGTSMILAATRHQYSSLLRRACWVRLAALRLNLRLSIRKSSLSAPCVPSKSGQQSRANNLQRQNHRYSRDYPVVFPS
jgi:hypothetical protein